MWTTEVVHTHFVYKWGKPEISPQYLTKARCAEAYPSAVLLSYAKAPTFCPRAGCSGRSRRRFRRNQRLMVPPFPPLLLRHVATFHLASQ